MIIFFDLPIKTRYISVFIYFIYSYFIKLLYLYYKNILITYYSGFTKPFEIKLA